MITLYDLQDAAALIKNKKKHRILLAVFAAVLLAVFVPWLIVEHTWYVFVLADLFTIAYAFYFLTFEAYIKKKDDAAYRFLAKIQQFDHRVSVGILSPFPKSTVTLQGKICYALRLENAEILYLEAEKDKAIFHGGKPLRFWSVEGIIIAYEVQPV